MKMGIVTTESLPEILQVKRRENAGACMIQSRFSTRNAASTSLRLGAILSEASGLQKLTREITMLCDIDIVSLASAFSVKLSQLASHFCDIISIDLSVTLSQLS